MITTLTGTSFIGYSRSTGTQPCGQAVNPATGEALAPVYLSATPDEVEKAMLLRFRFTRIYREKPVRLSCVKSPRKSKPWWRIS
jgi:2,5-dioxopentanoate dehydrogenase